MGWFRCALMLSVFLGCPQACTSLPTELKSPCVGTERSPCHFREVNNQWS